MNPKKLFCLLIALLLLASIGCAKKERKKNDATPAPTQGSQLAEATPLTSDLVNEATYAPYNPLDPGQEPLVTTAPSSEWVWETTAPAAEPAPWAWPDEPEPEPEPEPEDDGQPKTGVAAIDVIGADGIDWNHMTQEELYEMAKKEGGVVKIYATTTDANTAKKKIARDFPDVEFEFVQCDSDEVKGIIERDYDAGTINADVLLVKDSSGEIYNGLVQYDIVKVYYPAAICSHIAPALLEYGLPLYSAFNPWFYNTKDFPDGVPIKSWWDIVEGYNVDTQSYKDANGNDTQYWHIYTKDIKAPSYAALWAQLIVDSDALFAQYKEQYGEDLVITYTDKLQNNSFKDLPENNAGVELFWRFSQMKSYELSDGDAVVKAVNNSVNGPTLGLCSASKLDNRDMGMDIAWVTGLSPYTAQDAAAYVYVVSGCDNPAGARLYINYILGGEDGNSGCYTTFDKLGHWSVRDDVTYEKSGIEYKDVGLKAPDFESIFQYYSSVGSYWDLWSSWSK